MVYLPYQIGGKFAFCAGCGFSGGVEKKGRSATGGGTPGFSYAFSRAMAVWAALAASSV